MDAIDHKAIIRNAASKVGGVVALGKALGLTRGAVSQWPKVPDNWLLEVERLTGVPRAKLRPDIFSGQRRAMDMPRKRATDKPAAHGVVAKRIG